MQTLCSDWLNWAPGGSKISHIQHFAHNYGKLIFPVYYLGNKAQ